MNYSQSSMVERFAVDDGSLEQKMMQFSKAMSEEEEEVAALGKNAFMPQPLITQSTGQNQNWSID